MYLISNNVSRNVILLHEHQGGTMIAKNKKIQIAALLIAVLAVFGFVFRGIAAPAEVIQPEAAPEEETVFVELQAEAVAGFAALAEETVTRETLNNSILTVSAEIEAAKNPYYQKVVPSIDTLNVRSEASEEGSIVGKFYAGCVADVVEELDGWYRITSGEVTGFVNSEYVVTGAEAESLIAEQGPKVAIVEAKTLNVRMKANKNADVLAVVDNGQQFMVVSEEGEWTKIQFLSGQMGYVSTEYISVTDGTGRVVTMEEVRDLQNRVQEAKEDREAEAKKKEIQKTQNAAMAAAQDDVTLLAALCQYEAGSYEGQLAVANVVLNRVRSSAYPNTIYGVIFAKGQFGRVTSGALNKYLTNGPSATAMRAAQDALNGVNNVGDYTKFCAARLANVSSYSSYTVIGGNCFYSR